MSDHEISITIQTYAKEAIDQLSGISGQLSKLQTSVTKMSGALGRIETSLTGIAQSMNGVGTAAQGMQKQIRAVDSKPLQSVEKNLKGVKTEAKSAQDAVGRIDLKKALPTEKQPQAQKGLNTQLLLPERTLAGLKEVAGIRDRIIGQAGAYTSSLKGVTQAIPEGTVKNLGHYVTAMQNFKPGEQVNALKQISDMLKVGNVGQGGQLNMFTNMFAQMQTASKATKNSIDSETDSIDRMVEAENRAVDASRARASAETQTGRWRTTNGSQANMLRYLQENIRQVGDAKAFNQPFHKAIRTMYGDAEQEVRAGSGRFVNAVEGFNNKVAGFLKANTTAIDPLGEWLEGLSKKASAQIDAYLDIIKGKFYGGLNGLKSRVSGFVTAGLSELQNVTRNKQSHTGNIEEKIKRYKELTRTWGKYLSEFNDIQSRVETPGDGLAYFNSEQEKNRYLQLADAIREVKAERDSLGLSDPSSNEATALTERISYIKALLNGVSKAPNPALNEEEVTSYTDELASARAELERLLSTGATTTASNPLANAVSRVKGFSASIKSKFGEISSVARSAFDKLPSFIQKPMIAVGSLAKKTASDIKSAFVSAGKKAGYALGRGFSNLVTAPFRMVKNTFTSGLQDIQSRFTGIGKTIRSTIGMAWRLLLRQIIRSIFSSVAQGVQALAQYSSAFNATMSSLKSSLLTMRNALTVAFAPVLNAIAPVFDAIISKVVSAANAIGRFMSALTGKGFAIQAKRVSTSFASASSSAGSASKGASGLADNTKKAAESAEEYKKTLLGFDKIEKLAEQDTGSGSGSGSGSGGSGSGGSGSVEPSAYDMFETVAVDGQSQALANQFREALKTADFTDIGEEFGEKVTDALAGIDWSKYQHKAYKMGKGIATFINGAVEGTDWNVVGESVAGAVNTITELFYGFISKLNFKKLGDAFGTSISSAIRNINWAHAGYNVGRTIGGLFEFMNHTIMTTDFTGLGRSIATFFNNAFKQISPTEIAQTVGGIIKGALNAISGFFATLDPTELGNAIKEFVMNIDYKGILSAILDAIRSLSAFFIEGLLSLIDGVLGTDFSKKFKAWYDKKYPHGGSGTTEATVKVNVKNGKTDKLAEQALNSEGKTGTHTTKSDIKKGKWDKDATKTLALSAKKVNKTTSTLIQNVTKGVFVKDAWKAANKDGRTSATLTQSVTKGAWNFDAFNASNKSGGTTNRTLTQGVSKGSWNNDAWNAVNKAGGTIARILQQNVNKGSWNNDAWNASNKPSATINRTINVKVLMNAIGTGASVANAILKSVGLKADGGVFRGGKWSPIPMAAGGGAFNTGQLFVAREAGPELVSNIGHHTAVMNNDQIVASVSKGVYNAVLSAMSGSQQSVNVVIQGDADRFLRVLKEKSDNTMRATGQPIFKV